MKFPVVCKLLYNFPIITLHFSQGDNDSFTSAHKKLCLFFWSKISSFELEGNFSQISFWLFNAGCVAFARRNKFG